MGAEIWDPLIISILFTGLLGTITNTAETADCPGKCLHALASLLCDQVREDIKCPSSNLRCCVEPKRKKKKKPSQSQRPSNNNVNDNPTTVRATTIKKIKKKVTTVRTTTKKPVNINFFY